MRFKIAVRDLLKYTHGRILTFVKIGAISAYAEESNIDWYGNSELLKSKCLEKLWMLDVNWLM